MTTRHPKMIATVDERRARLFRCTPTVRDTWQLEETQTLRSVWEQDHERGRPSLLGRGPGTVPPHGVDPGHTEEEENRRFAGDVARWLAGQPSLVLVFAPPKFLGLLRQHASGWRDERVRLVECELTRLTPDELAVHPAVLAQLSAAPTGV